ncbi:DMT family transporter [Chryseobacterium sp. R2A-55]|uniref:DMT family transporter n=1 Tax=Chryseobacterium sp. R2A-55 TaxID=2744445 RepID=UPI001F16C8A4|nr:DMT family transporter [Chryseobacterium sp. R2A-55]
MNHEREKWILLIILTIIWGSSFILIKKSLDYYNPFEVGSLRIMIAGLLLMPVAFLNMKKFPKKNLKWLLLAAACGNFFPMYLFPIAETKISSSVAGIINSMVPIFVILIGPFLWKEVSTKFQKIGVAISFAGVCILTLGSHEAGELKLIPIVLLLLATLMYAINALTVKKKLNHVEPIALSAFVFGFVLFLPSLISLAVSGFFHDFHFTKGNFIGIGFVSLLAIFGTGLAMMLNYRILRISTALFASTVTLLMPIVAVIWGIIDGEKLTFMQIFGGVVIMGGLIFLRSRPTHKKQKTALPEDSAV